MSDLSAFKLVTKADVAAIFGVCSKSIDNYIKQGELPAPVQFMSKEYWHPEEFKAFLDRRFKRSPAAVVADVGMPPLGTDDLLTVGDAIPNNARRSRAVVDSSATIRQMARQSEKLKALNG